MLLLIEYLLLLIFGCIPKELSNIKLEFTPVDYCADFIVKLMELQKNNIEIYHLFNNNSINGNEFINLLNKLNITINLSTIDKFKHTLQETSNRNNYFGIINYIDNISATNSVSINNNLTNDILKSMNIEWPKVDLPYITKIINYLKSNKLIGE